MQFPHPAGRMVKVLVLLILHLIVGALQEFPQRAFDGIRYGADDLPVHVILGLRLYNTLRGNDLRRLRLAGHPGNFHRLDER